MANFQNGMEERSRSVLKVAGPTIPFWNRKTKHDAANKQRGKSMSDPVNYWEDEKINLYFKSTKDCSVDEVGAKKHKVKATAPGKFVSQLQSDLVTIGYLESGAASTDGYFSGGTRRAVLRLQRHAG